jgi:ABC-type multidrug transport system fused ATPase/permease subunit
MRLSDGQHQRLSIAWAVFKNSAILILDEATLVLGTESERLVWDALKKNDGRQDDSVNSPPLERHY